MSIAGNREIEAASTLRGVVAAQARRDPDAPAILAPGRPALRYGALLEVIDRAVRSLANAGLGRGSRIVVALPNGPETAVALLAVGSCATCAPLNPATDEEACRVLLKGLRADAVIVARGDRSAVRRVAQTLGLPVVEVIPSIREGAGAFVPDIDRRAAPPPGGSPQAQDLALLMSTSGTTGKARIVPIAQGDLIESVRRQIRAIALTSADRCLCVAPLFTTSGIRRNLLNVMVVGGSVVCVEAFRARLFVDWIREFNPTYYSAGPAIHVAVLEEHERNGSIGPSSLRLVWSGATALPVEVQRRLERLLGVPVIQSYAMSEAGLVACNPLPPGIRRPGSVGRPVGLDVVIHGDAGNALPAFETGEVVIRGPCIRQYVDNPEANREAFRDGWFRTGDLGYFDAAGYLFLTGRVKELINRGGLKVSPYEVDAALMRHPDVAEAATFAVPHPTLGEDVNTAVVLRNATVTAQQLRDFALERLALYKVPSQVVMVAKLPKGPLGKIRRREIARLLGASLHQKFTPPRGESEERVAGVFAAILGVPRVGAFDNFFHLGGDSLRGAQVLAQLNAMLGSNLTTALLFRRPTVAEFAAELAGVGAVGPQPGLPPIATLRRIGQRVDAIGEEKGTEP
jgi:acyl-CoA synthetase (AMP-forming)/AMP-acid ligase II